MLPKVFQLKKYTQKCEMCAASKAKFKQNQSKGKGQSIACMNFCLDTSWGWFSVKQVLKNNIF
jgi:hypothetical protein